MESHSTLQTLIENIDGPLAMLERKERMDRMFDPAPAISIFPMRRPQEFEDSINISDADRAWLEEKHNNPFPQRQMPLNPRAMDWQPQASANWETQWNVENWVDRQPNADQYEHSEREQGSLGTFGNLESSQFSGVPSPVAGSSVADGYDFGHESFYAPESQLYLQQQQQGQLYDFYQAYDQGFPSDPYASMYGYGMTTLDQSVDVPTQPAPSAPETLNAGFYGLPFTVEAFFPMAPEEEHFAAGSPQGNFPTLPAGLPESISDACLWSVVFGSNQEDDSIAAEEEVHRMRFAPQDQVLDPVDESVHFGELRFERKKPADKTAESAENVEGYQDKPAEEAQDEGDTDVTENEPTSEPTPEPTLEPVQAGQNHDQFGVPISLNTLFGIAGPGHDADNNTRGEPATPTTTRRTTNARRGRRSWASVVRERKA